MTEVQKTEGATETPLTPPQETKPVETPATVTPEPVTPPVEMVTVPKSKLEHMVVRNRQLRDALYTKNPEQAKVIEDQETRRVKDVLEDMVLANPAYAQVMSQNQHLRTIIRTNPLSLIPADEVLYDDDDIREVLTTVLDKEVGTSLSTRVDKTPASTPDNNPPTPTPATPPSSATPNVPPEPPRKKNPSLAEGHREPMKRVEGSIAERIRNAGK